MPATSTTTRTRNSKAADRGRKAGAQGPTRADDKKAAEQRKRADAKAKADAKKAAERQKKADAKAKADAKKTAERQKKADAKAKADAKQARPTKARTERAGRGPARSDGGRGKRGSSGPGKGKQSRGDGSGSEVAAELGKDDQVTRQTKSPTTAASYLTRDHDIIQSWVSERGGVPADVRGTENGSGAGVLRIEFRDPADRLEDVEWDAFFETFDRSDVDFLYQEHTADGSISRFNRFVREA